MIWKSLLLFSVVLSANLALAAGLALRAALWGKLPRLGLIGSATKKARFLGALRARGRGSAALERLEQKYLARRVFPGAKNRFCSGPGREFWLACRANESRKNWLNWA